MNSIEDHPTLQAWLEAGENEQIEFKRDTSSERFREQFCSTICAFANDLPVSRKEGIFGSFEFQVGNAK